MNLPFKMRVTNNTERYRGDWFWGKEPETIAWIEGMTPGSRLWDIGANIGVYALYASHLGVEVWAFEPSNKNYQALLLNKEDNDFRNLSVVKRAISNRDGLSVFNEYFEAGMSGHSIGEGGRCCLESRGDTLVENGYPVPQHIKIDVDGKELDVLCGCEKMLSNVDSLCVEVNNWSIVSWLGSRGFHEDLRYTTLKRPGGMNIIFRRKL